MMALKSVLFYIFVCVCLLVSFSQAFRHRRFFYDIREFEVPLDHFNYALNKTFTIRYLYNGSFIDINAITPLFFYTGNEGDIEIFAQNTGFLWELAEKFKACVVFAEHRYYGKSLPFGNATFSNKEHIGYLSIEQTLEDFSILINYLRTERISPVIAFGGSYGGMLSTWMRLKFPHIIYGALASSAPIWQFNGLTPCDIFSKITTSVFTSSLSSNCSINIKNSWTLLTNLSSSEEGRRFISENFHFCSPMKHSEDINEFMDFLEDVYENLAMSNYPYENDFLAPLPAFPVRQFCSNLIHIYESDALVTALQRAISVYTNYTGTAKCLDYKSAYSPNLGGIAWKIQTCNEIVMPMCSNFNGSMFRKEDWNFSTYSNKCLNKFKIRPRLNDVAYRYGGKNLMFASNIIFSNGLLDPWSGGGVLQTTNSKIDIIIIPEGAHHLDLRESNPSDPISVREARIKEMEIIEEWILNFSNLKHF